MEKCCFGCSAGAGKCAPGLLLLSPAEPGDTWARTCGTQRAGEGSLLVPPCPGCPLPSLSGSTCQGCWKPLPRGAPADSDGCKSQGTELMSPVLLDNNDISVIGLEHLHNLGTSCYLHGDICLHAFPSICIPMKLHPQQLSS